MRERLSYEELRTFAVALAPHLTGWQASGYLTEDERRDGARLQLATAADSLPPGVSWPYLTIREDWNSNGQTRITVGFWGWPSSPERNGHNGGYGAIILPRDVAPYSERDTVPGDSITLGWDRAKAAPERAAKEIVRRLLTDLWPWYLKTLEAVRERRAQQEAEAGAVLAVLALLPPGASESTHNPGAIWTGSSLPWLRDLKLSVYSGRATVSAEVSGLTLDQFKALLALMATK